MMLKAFLSKAKRLIFSAICSYSHLGIAEGIEGRAIPWQVGFQSPASPIMSQIESFHTILMVMIVGIGLFVMGLLIFVIWRFQKSKNPIPSQNAHNTKLEIIWTAIPVMLLAIIAFPSFKLLYSMDHVEEADMTVKVIAHQWYWSYEYPDHGNFSFDSYMVPHAELKKGDLRLLEVDHPMVVPVRKNIRIIATSTDVIHSWAVPSLGVKKDSVPGRINETWFRIEKEGTYYGQCSELCGPGHGFMPIVVKAISEDKFKEWTQGQGKFLEDIRNQDNTNSNSPIEQINGDSPHG
jgi:cytochrome c oxidase subunit 2